MDSVHTMLDVSDMRTWTEFTISIVSQYQNFSPLQTSQLSAYEASSHNARTLRCEHMDGVHTILDLSYEGILKRSQNARTLRCEHLGRVRSVIDHSYVSTIMEFHAMLYISDVKAWTKITLCKSSYM